jgi:rsbT co-antagonist protein RsbR
MLHPLLSVPGDADTARRGRTLIILALLLFAINLLRLPLTLLLQASLPPALLAALIGALGTLGPIWLARCGHVDAAGWLLIATVSVAVSSSPIMQQRLPPSSFFLVLPVMLAGVCLRPRAVSLAAALVLGCLGVIGYVAGIGPGHSSLNSLVVLALLIITTGAIAAVGATVASNTFALVGEARRAAEEAQSRVEELNAGLAEQVAAQTAELREALVEVEARAAESQALLDKVAAQREIIREMSTPVLPVRDGTLVMPLVGDLDERRLQDIQTQALCAVEQFNARTLLLDVTGVAVVDTYVAKGLVQTMHASRLLGAEPVLVGVRPEVAQTLVTLGVDLSDVRVAADLAGGLAMHDRSVASLRRSPAAAVRA